MSRHNRNQQSQPQRAVQSVAEAAAKSESSEDMRDSVARALEPDEPVDPRSSWVSAAEAFGLPALEDAPVAVLMGDSSDMSAAADRLERFAGLRPFNVKGPGSLMIDGALKAPGTRLDLDYAMFKLLRADLTQG